MKRALVIVLFLLSAALIGATCRLNTTPAMPAGKVIQSVKVNNLTATLMTSDEHLKQGNQEVTLAFSDAQGKPIDVGAVSLNFHMPKMGSMAEMNNGVTLTTTNTPGVYRGKVNIEAGGEWQAQLAYEGPAGKGKTTFSVTAQ